MCNQDVVDKYFATMNAELWDEFRTVWTDDAVVTPVGTYARVGPDEITKFYSGLFGPWETHWDQPTRFYTAPDGSISAGVTFTGRTRNGGLEVSFDAADLFEFRGGKISKLANFYDLLWVRKQLARQP